MATNRMQDNNVEDPDRVREEVFLDVIDGTLQWMTNSTDADGWAVRTANVLNGLSDSE